MSEKLWGTLAWLGAGLLGLVLYKFASMVIQGALEASLCLIVGGGILLYVFGGLLVGGIFVLVIVGAMMLFT